MIIQIAKIDLPSAKVGDPISLMGNVVVENGEMLELEVDVEAAAPAPTGPASFDEMENQLKSESSI